MMATCFSTAADPLILGSPNCQENMLLAKWVAYAAYNYYETKIVSKAKGYHEFGR